MCNWLSDRMERYLNRINLIWFSDEAHFHLNDAINNHNNIFWGAEPPERITERYLKGAYGHMLLHLQCQMGNTRAFPGLRMTTAGR